MAGYSCGWPNWILSRHLPRLGLQHGTQHSCRRPAQKSPSIQNKAFFSWVYSSRQPPYSLGETVCMICRNLRAWFGDYILSQLKAPNHECTRKNPIHIAHYTLQHPLCNLTQCDSEVSRFRVSRRQCLRALSLLLQSASDCHPAPTASCFFAATICQPLPAM